MRGRDLRLRTPQIGRADLYAGGPEREGSHDAARIGDAARGDHRHLHRIDDLRNEGERTGLGGCVVAQEDAAMAAGLVALRDHGVDAARFEPARLGRGGRRTHHQEASRLEPLQQPRLRQPEMEAHDVGLRLLDDIAHDGIERGAIARGDRRGGIDREFAVIRRQSFPPARLAGVVEHRRRVAEEIEI